MKRGYPNFDGYPQVNLMPPRASPPKEKRRRKKKKKTNQIKKICVFRS